jgi:hypothetical protein
MVKNVMRLDESQKPRACVTRAFRGQSHILPHRPYRQATETLSDCNKKTILVAVSRVDISTLNCPRADDNDPTLIGKIELAVT